MKITIEKLVFWGNLHDIPHFLNFQNTFGPKRKVPKAKVLTSFLPKNIHYKSSDLTNIYVARSGHIRNYV